MERTGADSNKKKCSSRQVREVEDTHSGADAGCCTSGHGFVLLLSTTNFCSHHPRSQMPGEIHPHHRHDHGLAHGSAHLG